MNELNQDQKSQLHYQGDLTLEALSVIDTYQKLCCNKSATSRKLNQAYCKVARVLKQPYVRELFKLKLLEKGITPDRIAESIKDGIEASNGVYYEGGKVADEPNWAARQKFNQLACEIFEVLKYQAKADVNINNNVVIQNFANLIEAAHEEKENADRDFTRDNSG